MLYVPPFITKFSSYMCLFICCLRNFGVAYSDTFPWSRRCHCKQLSLYCKFLFSLYLSGRWEIVEQNQFGSFQLECLLYCSPNGEVCFCEAKWRINGCNNSLICIWGKSISPKLHNSNKYFIFRTKKHNL